MEVTRRDTMAIGGAAVISTLIPSISVASTNDLIMGITGGADAVSSGIDLTAPEIAENGNTVPISVDAPGAVAVTILAALLVVPPDFIAPAALSPILRILQWQKV